MKILHVLDHSLPVQSGYAFRSASIIQQQQRMGIETVVLTGPKQEGGKESDTGDECIDYLRTPVAKGEIGNGVGAQLSTIRLLRRRLRDVQGQVRADIIHAHSPCLNGLAALGLGVPVVYEMRSSWEDAAVSSGTTAEGSIRYRLSRTLETLVLRRADAVTTICEGLKREILSRGVDERMVTVVPNAIDLEMFMPADGLAIENVRKKHGLDGKSVIGFFGSFFEWEGLHHLIEAMPGILHHHPDAVLFLVGSGREQHRLNKLAQVSGLSDQIMFAGRVPHTEITACYGAADVMVYPRSSSYLTETVTPLKPIEAMALGKLVVASDVGGHKEIVEDGNTGYLFEPGNPAAIASTVSRALHDPRDAERIRRNARRYVETERTWDVSVARCLPVYQRLLRS